MAMRRLFVSVDLPEPLIEPLAAVQEPFVDLDGVRTVDPTQAHFTVKFLGDVPDDRVDSAIETLTVAVDDADLGAFSATLGGLGVFPSYEYISVIWLGVRDGAPELTAIHEAVEAAFVEAGYEPESHDFTPHMTIARMDHAGAKERVQELVTSRNPLVGSMAVNEVRLTESILQPSGPVYETVHEVRLREQTVDRTDR